MKKIFKFILLLYIINIITIAIITKLNPLPEILANNSGKLLPFMENYFGLYMIIITLGFIFIFIGLIGMFFSAAWARHLFLIAIIFHMFTMSITKYNTSSGIEDMFTYIEGMITGVILYIIYSNAGKCIFQKDKYI